MITDASSDTPYLSEGDVCTGCGAHPVLAVVVGGLPVSLRKEEVVFDYDSHTALLCEECVRKALALFPGAAE